MTMDVDRGGASSIAHPLCDDDSHNSGYAPQPWEQPVRPARKVPRSEQAAASPLGFSPAGPPPRAKASECPQASAGTGALSGWVFVWCARVRLRVAAKHPVASLGEPANQPIRLDGIVQPGRSPAVG